MSFCKCNLDEFEYGIGEFVRSNSDRERILIREEENAYQEWAEPEYLHINDLNINVFSAVCLNYDEKQRDYEISHDLYVFYDSKTGERVYSESGSSLPVCVHNYCHFAGVKVNDIEGLSCTYIHDNGKFLNEKAANW